MRESKTREGGPKFKKYAIFRKFQNSFAATKIQNKFLDSSVDPNTRYGQLHIAEGYKAVHSKVFDNSLKTMDQLIAASEKKRPLKNKAQGR